MGDKEPAATAAAAAAAAVTMQQQPETRRDTPAPSHLRPAAMTDSELEEKVAAVGLGDLVEVSIEEEHDAGRAARDSWTRAPPTVVQLPSQRERRLAPVSAAAAAASALSDDGAEQIDADVFNALPAELQEEILAEREARDASFGSQISATASPPEVDADCWTCRVCTFANHPQLTECEMCETPLFEQPDELAFGAEQIELRDASRASTGTRSRASSAGSELYSKLSEKLGSSAVSRSLKKIRLPATPTATKLTMKDEPTAEDLLVVATAKIQQLQSSASQTLSHAKQTLLARTNSGSRKSGLLGVPSAAAASELGVLQRDLNRKCEGGDELYETLLERLWNAVYQDSPALCKQSENGDLAGSGAPPPFRKREFARVSDGWVDIGFQSANPDTDFRGGGILALKCLVYVFEAFPQRMVAIAAAQKPMEGKKWYPVCVAGINLTCMIAGLLKLGNGEFGDTPALHWKLFEEPSAFYQLFFYALVKMDATWRRTNASYMEFGGVLKSTRRITAHMLEQAPASLNDLRDVADRTFLDRFVVCHTNRTLADSENGECPDPYNVLEDEDDAVLRPSRAALSARRSAVSLMH